MAARWCPHHLHPHHHQHLHDDHHQVPQVDIERLPDHMLKEWETEPEVKFKKAFVLLGNPQPLAAASMLLQKIPLL